MDDSRFNSIVSSFCVLVLLSFKNPLIFQYLTCSYWKILQLNKNCEQTTKLYRQIQVLNVLCNSVTQSCLGVAIFAAISLVGMSLALLIRTGKSNFDQGNIAFLLILAVTAVDCLLLLVALTSGMVKVFAESANLHINVERLYLGNVLLKRDKKWMEKFWNSCDKIKIKFGDNNYLEEVTPLKCLDCSLQFTMQVLLLSGYR